MKGHTVRYGLLGCSVEDTVVVQAGPGCPHLFQQWQQVLPGLTPQMECSTTSSAPASAPSWGLFVSVHTPPWVHLHRTHEVSAVALV